MSQLNAIKNRDAFLIYLLDDKDTMIGGGYFALTRTEGLYAVGVYDRTLFDRPVGYLVQHDAIKEMIRRGIRWYKLGALPFETDDPTPTEKEVSIGAFKKHFSSHAFPKYIFTHPLTECI
jgi:lipid II:glycine glycyltransferase (peptidoglycan interpeptide bridge formation enzyme)